MLAARNERHWERSIELVQYQIDSREVSKRRLRRVRQFIGDDATPHGVEGGDAIDRIAGVRCQVEVIEGQFFGIPQKVEDSGPESVGSLAVSTGSSGVLLLGVEVGKDLVIAVCRRLSE